MAESRGQVFYLLDGFDDAILGTVDLGNGVMSVAYSTRAIIDQLINAGMSREEAYDYFGFNIESDPVTPGSPVLVDDDFR